MDDTTHAINDVADMLMAELRSTVLAKDTGETVIVEPNIALDVLLESLPPPKPLDPPSA